MSPEQIANIRALADGGVSGPDDVLALCNALAAAEKALADGRAKVAAAERERDEARFRPPLGDNHHNALRCPYCTPPALAQAIEDVVRLGSVGVQPPLAQALAALRAEWRGA